jgi:hypothetical protein
MTKTYTATIERTTVHTTEVQVEAESEDDALQQIGDMAEQAESGDGPLCIGNIEELDEQPYWEYESVEYDCFYATPND